MSICPLLPTVSVKPPPSPTPGKALECLCFLAAGSGRQRERKQDTFWEGQPGSCTFGRWVGVMERRLLPPQRTHHRHPPTSPPFTPTLGSPLLCTTRPHSGVKASSRLPPMDTCPPSFFVYSFMYSYIHSFNKCVPLICKTLSIYLFQPLCVRVCFCELATLSRPDPLRHVLHGPPGCDHCRHSQHHSPCHHGCPSRTLRLAVVRVQYALSCYPCVCMCCSCGLTMSQSVKPSLTIKTSLSVLLATSHCRTRGYESQPPPGPTRSPNGERTGPLETKEVHPREAAIQSGNVSPALPGLPIFKRSREFVFLLKIS